MFVTLLEEFIWMIDINTNSILQITDVMCYFKVLCTCYLVMTSFDILNYLQITNRVKVRLKIDNKIHILLYVYIGNKLSCAYCSRINCVTSYNNVQRFTSSKMVLLVYILCREHIFQNVINYFLHTHSLPFCIENLIQ